MMMRNKLEENWKRCVPAHTALDEPRRQAEYEALHASVHVVLAQVGTLSVPRKTNEQPDPVQHEQSQPRLCTLTIERRNTTRNSIVDRDKKK